MSNLILCDLDGTLIRHGHPLSPETRQCFAALRNKGDVVAVASGRSLFSGRNIMTPDVQAAYWIFSTGAGILDCRNRGIVRRCELTPQQVNRAVGQLTKMQVDFMIQAPIPENHRFVYYKFDTPENSGTDFGVRCQAYPGLCKPLTSPDARADGPASQLIAILPPDLKRIERVRDALNKLVVVRATSPMDNWSVWLEIFAPGAGKAAGGQWLAEQPNLNVTDTFAIGNDYNDLDMLQWANHPFVTPNAPDELKDMFPTTAADTDGAFAEAVHSWKLL